VAIARAFLRDAPICTLDETTSALHSEPEVIRHEAFDKFAYDRTVIAEAYRPSTRQVIDQGASTVLPHPPGPYSEPLPC
jgi:ABC-type multidrug transport system fused ATPase/permease subunit